MVHTAHVAQQTKPEHEAGGERNRRGAEPLAGAMARAHDQGID